MGSTPLSDPLYMDRTTEIVPVLRLLAPGALTLAVTLGTALKGTVTILLTMPVLGCRKKTDVTMRTDGISLCH